MSDSEKRLAAMQRSLTRHDRRSLFGALASLFGRAEIVPTDQHSRETVARYKQVEASSKSRHIIDM